MEFKKFMEALKGNQHKLDKNKNGKLDADDFQKLRKEETIEEESDAYAKSEENKRSADAAKKQGDMFAHHLHMADHHDNLAQWHGEKGRHSTADSHAEKSEQHHDMAMKLKMKKEEVELDEATPYYNKPSWIKKMSAAAKQERLAREKKEKEAKPQVKEESELEEASIESRSDYKIDKAGRKSHKQITFKDGSTTGNEKEDEMKEEKMSDADMKERERIVKGMKKNISGFKAKYGERAKEVMYATATKMAMKESEEIEEETLDEKSEQARRNKTMKNMMDASRGARYKVQNKLSGDAVRDWDGKHKTAQAQNKAIGRALRNEDLEESVKPGETHHIDWDGKSHVHVSKVEGDNVHLIRLNRPIHKDKSQPVRPEDKIVMSKKEFHASKIKESVELEEAVESGNKGYGYHGQHDSEVADKKYSAAHAKVKKIAGEAGHLRDAKKPNVMVKHYLDSKHGRHLAGLEHDHEYIKKDFGKFKKAYKPELHEGVNFDEQGNLMAEKLKFADFIAKMNEQLLEYETDSSGVYRHTKKATYGTSYQGDDDEDEKPKKAAAPDAPKRGRGRPAGSTGASYKPRSAATAAAAKAKAAATKAANKK